MDLSDLRFADVLTLLAVTRCGSITGAARELKVTPSQVSKSVTRLERQLQVKLLARTARGVAVSEVGLRLMPALEDVVQRLHALNASPQRRTPELTLAAPSYLTTVLMPVIAEAAPQYRVRGLEMPPRLLRHYAADRFFDLALTSGRDRLPEPWVGTHLGDLRKALFATREVARQLGKPPVPVERVRGVAFVSPIYSSNGQFVPVDDECPLKSGDRLMGHQAQTIGLALELASRCGQLVFGPVIAARRYLKEKTLVEIPVEGWEVHEPLHLACNGDRVLASVQKSVVAALCRAVAEMQ